MTDPTPITPPPQLVQQWFKQAHESADPDNQLSYYDFIATAAAQWGWDQRGTIDEAQLQERADQELEACCEWLGEDPVVMRHVCTGSYLRGARRPKPATLNSIALQMLGTIERDAHYLPEITDTIRRALEQLND